MENIVGPKWVLILLEIILLTIPSTGEIFLKQRMVRMVITNLEYLVFVYVIRDFDIYTGELS